jgi:16S rRNA (cytosine967-C5)-methyltransferase
MTTKFRNTHLIQILKGFATQQQKSLPLDLFLKNYFYKNRSLGSHDRKYLTETVYKSIRWQGLIAYLAKEDLSLEHRIEIAEKLTPENYLNDSSIPLHNRVSFPEKYFSFLVEELGEEKATEFCLASNYPAPTTIRANTIKTTRDALLERLSSKESVSPGKFSPTAIHFAHRVNFLLLPEFKEGLFEVQDEASQMASFQVQAKSGDHFLDYCAGSGGKSLAIAPQMKGKGQLYLHDIRTHVLEEAKKRLKRAGIQNAKILEPKDLRKLEGKMDWVLVDVPCSGSGTLRRNPDMKWKFEKESLEKTVATQREVFAKGLCFVKPKGHIVYTTCSVLPTENEKQIAYFLEHFAVEKVGESFQSFPSQGMDGFYSTVLRKSN